MIDFFHVSTNHMNAVFAISALVEATLGFVLMQSFVSQNGRG